MAVSATVTPGKIFGSTEVITISELNKLGSPTVDISGAVGSLSLSDGSVTNAKVAAGTGVQLDKMETGTSAQVIVANSSGDGVWVDLSGDVTVDNAGVMTIGTDKVLTANILDANVTTAKIADNAVDGTKLAMGSDVQGDVLYFDGTDYVRLGAGTDGEFLQTQGASSSPTWAALPPAETVFTSTGPWTKPTGVTLIQVFVTGGGGGGAGGAQWYPGGAGGRGGAASDWIDVSAVSSVTATVGTGGSGGAGGTSYSHGSGGGDSSFGSYMTGLGGEGGTWPSHAGPGAVGDVGTVTGSQGTCLDVTGNVVNDTYGGGGTAGTSGSGAGGTGSDGAVVVRVIG